MSSDTGHKVSFRKFWTLSFSILLAGAGAVGAVATPAQAADDTISGIAEVIDADVLKFDKQRVILWGVDSPERNQQCFLNGEIWGCYDVALRQLQLLAQRGEVTCTLRGEADPFGRRYGVCVSGGDDINAEMVRAGVALAYDEQSEDYDAAMADAITAGVGLWQPGVVFEEPWVYRRRENPGGYR